MCEDCFLLHIPPSYHTAAITHLYLLFYCTTVIKSILFPSSQHRHVALCVPWFPQSLPCWARGGEAAADPLAPRRKENGSALKEIDSAGHEKKSLVRFKNWNIPPHFVALPQAK